MSGQIVGKVALGLAEKDLMRIQLFLDSIKDGFDCIQRIFRSGSRLPKEQIRLRVASIMPLVVKAASA